MKAVRIGAAVALAIAGASAWAQSCTVGSAPQTTQDFYTAVKGSPLPIGSGNGVLVNDKVCNAQTGLFVPALTYAGVSVAVVGGSGPSNGTLTMNTADGSFLYTPNAGFTGFDTFQYVLNDGNQGMPAAPSAQNANKVLSLATLVTIKVPAPEPAPTLSEWGLMALAASMAVAGGVYARRRRKA